MSIDVLRVEVAYAGPEGQWLIALALPHGATLGQAIDASGIRTRIRSVAVADTNVGIYGRPCRLDTPLRDGDRVEIYRPLVADPKAQRRARARAQHR